LDVVLNLILGDFMPSVAKRKAKNTQNEQRKKMDREKEAKKKQMRAQLPANGQKRCSIKNRNSRLISVFDGTYAFFVALY